MVRTTTTKSEVTGFDTYREKPRTVTPEDITLSWKQAFKRIYYSFLHLGPKAAIFTYEALVKY